MRHLIVLLVAVFFAGSALAGQCPSLVGEIDDRLRTDQLDSETVAKVKKLRDHGQSLHSQGKHDESVRVLKQALDEIESMKEIEGEA